MNKLTVLSIAAIIILPIFTAMTFAEDLKPIQLMTPQVDGGKPLMKALKDRSSSRSFSKEKLSAQMLSNLLWAAFGINRPDTGHRTAPSARNWQEIDIYVDLKHGFILLSHTKNGERREIPINATLRVTLQSLPRQLHTQHVFFDPATGKPYKEVKKSFATALRRAKIQDFHFHDLRHTFSSQLVMSGVDLVTVKELLGHADIKMTLRYAHLAPSHKVKAVEIYEKNMWRYKSATVMGEEKVASL